MTPLPRLPARRLRLYGVTIVELMVTLAILSVLLAVAMPSMRDFVARKRLEGVAQELLTDLRLLKSQQLQSRRPVAINFGSTAGETCYVLYFTGLSREHCDCTRAAESVCWPVGTVGRPEQIRLVSVPRSTGVAVTANRRFLKLLGFDGMPEGNAELLASVESSQVGSIRVTMNSVGTPALCSVSGVFGAITKCPP